MLEAMLASDAVYAIGWALVQFVWQGALAGIMIWAVLALLSGHDAQNPLLGGLHESVSHARFAPRDGAAYLRR